MDKLSLEFEITYRSNSKLWDFETIIYINGERFLDKYYFDIWEIDKTCAKSGEYELFTCGCGDAGCAGIFTTPKVKIGENVIFWHIFEPKEYMLKFDKVSYRNEILNLKRKMLDFYSFAEWKKVSYFYTNNVANLPFLNNEF